MRLLILAIGLSLTVPAFAAGDFSQTFQAKAKAIPAKLISLSYTSFGSLDLNELLNHATGVRAEFSDKVAEMNGNGRLSAHWTVVNGVRTVYVYQAWWNRFAEEQSVLALHEILGVAGFIDDQYWISTSMWLLTLPEAATALNDFNRNQIVQWITANANARLKKGTQMAGGVVGVGGGGEGGTLYVKMHALQRILQKLNGPLPEDERTMEVNSLAHYLSSPLTVTWGNRGFKRRAP